MADTKGEDPQVKSRAGADADTVKGRNANEQAEAYHTAYTKFANDLHGNSNLTDQQRADQLTQYRADMSRNLGDAYLHQLELTWATTSNHMDAFPHQTIGSRGAGSGDLNGDRLKDFKSKNTDAGEAAFENSVAQELYKRYNNSEFSSYRHNISKDDLNERVKSLGSEAAAQSKVTPEAKLLASPAGQDTSGKDVTLFDRISADGNYVDMARNGKLAQLAGIVEQGTRPAWMTDEQAKEVQKLHGYARDPNGSPNAKDINNLMKGSTGISKESLENATGQSFDSLREMNRPAEAYKPQPSATEKEAEERKKDAGSLSASLKAGDVPLGDMGMKGPNDPIQKANVDAKLKELQGNGAGNDSDKKEAAALGTLQKRWDEIAGEKGKTSLTPEQISTWSTANGAEFRGFAAPKPEPQAELGKQLAEQRDRLSEPMLKDQRLGRGPVIDQARALLADRYKQLGLEMPKSEPEQNTMARQYLHRLGDANGWNVTPQQWAKYEKSGSPRDLPISLNEELDVRKALKQPGLSDGEQQALNAKVLQPQATEEGVNKVLQGMEPDKRTDVGKKVTDAYTAAYPGQTVAADKVGAAVMQLSKEQGDRAPEVVKGLVGEASKQDQLEKQQALDAEDKRRTEQAAEAAKTKSEGDMANRVLASMPHDQRAPAMSAIQQAFAKAHGGNWKGNDNDVGPAAMQLAKEQGENAPPEVKAVVKGVRDQQAVVEEAHEWAKAFKDFGEENGTLLLKCLFPGQGNDGRNYKMTADTVKATLADGKLSQVFNDEQKKYLTELQARLRQSRASISYADFAAAY